MILKSRCIQLSIARLHSDEGQKDQEGLRDQGEPVGTVTLKFVVSPLTIDLGNVAGMKTFAARLHHVIMKWF